MRLPWDTKHRSKLLFLGMRSHLRVLWRKTPPRWGGGARNERGRKAESRGVTEQRDAAQLLLAGALLSDHAPAHSSHPGARPDAKRRKELRAGKKMSSKNPRLSIYRIGPRCRAWGGCRTYKRKKRDGKKMTAVNARQQRSRKKSNRNLTREGQHKSREANSHGQHRPAGPRRGRPKRGQPASARRSR